MPRSFQIFTASRIRSQPLIQLSLPQAMIMSLSLSMLSIALASFLGIWLKFIYINPGREMMQYMPI